MSSASRPSRYRRFRSDEKSGASRLSRISTSFLPIFGTLRAVPNATKSSKQGIMLFAVKKNVFSIRPYVPLCN